jgi:hypothetical protein
MVSLRRSLPGAAALAAVLVLCLFPSPARAQAAPADPPRGRWGRYQARVSATQAAQPHWITPLVTVTPRLEQEFRTDFVRQYTPKGATTWNYGNGKGLEFIPERHTEILLNVPPYLRHSNDAPDGFGDVSFLLKERILARNEQHGNAILTAFLGASVPTGKNGNGSCCAIVTPTLAMGKGFGGLALTTTAGGSLPVTGQQKLGHTIAWNSVAQYRLGRSGLGGRCWPEFEVNASFYKGGANDGKVAAFGTPGIVFGRFPLRHDAQGEPGRLGLTFGAGEQIAMTRFHTCNHALVLTARLPF